MKPKTKNILIFIFVVAQMLDLIMTVTAIKYLGGREIGPFLRGMELFQIIVIKTVIVSLIYIVLKQNHFKGWVYHVVAFMSAVPVVWNGLQIALFWINSVGT